MLLCLLVEAQPLIEPHSMGCEGHRPARRGAPPAPPADGSPRPALPHDLASLDGPPRPRAQPDRSRHWWRAPRPPDPPRPRCSRSRLSRAGYGAGSKTPLPGPKTVVHEQCLQLTHRQGMTLQGSLQGHPQAGRKPEEPTAVEKLRSVLGSLCISGHRPRQRDGDGRMILSMKAAC